MRNLNLTVWFHTQRPPISALVFRISMEISLSKKSTVITEKMCVDIIIATTINLGICYSTKLINLEISVDPS